MGDGRYVLEFSYIVMIVVTFMLINDWVLVTFTIFFVAMERAVYSSKSFLIGLALVKKHLSAEQASEASHVEVNSQIQSWGMVEDCTWLS